MTEDNISLYWDNFSTHIQDTFGQLWKKKTLQTQNILIYLKDIRQKELETVLRFIYFDQCELEQEDLSLFLATASTLGVKGVKHQGNTQNEHESNKENIDIIADDTDIKTISKEMISAKDDIKINIKQKSESQRQTNIVKDCRAQEIDIKTEKQEINEENNFNVSDNKDPNFQCRKCDAEYYSRMEFIKHCKLLHEISSKQEGMTYNCDLCDFTSSCKSSLAKHKLSIHDGVKYKCEYCNHTATRKAHLKEHIQYQHKGFRFKCDQCEYKASRGGLQSHKKSQHLGVRYGCGQCYLPNNSIKKN